MTAPPRLFGLEMVKSGERALFELEFAGGGYASVFSNDGGRSWLAIAHGGKFSSGIFRGLSAQDAVNGVAEALSSLVCVVGPLIGWQCVPAGYEVRRAPAEQCPGCGATPFATTDGHCVKCGYGHK